MNQIFRVLSLLSGLYIAFFYSLVISGQCMSIPVSLSERVHSSESIVLGYVTAKTPYLYEPNGRIYTLNKLEVIAWLKNGKSLHHIYVITQGGILDNKATVVTPSLQLDPANEYIVFLEADNYKLDHKQIRQSEPYAIQAMAYADAQGVLTKQFGKYTDAYSEPEQEEQSIFQKIRDLTGEDAITPEGILFLPRPFDGGRISGRSVTISNFTPNPTNAGTVETADFLTITGNNFGSNAGTVFYRNADNGGTNYISSGVASDNVSWSNTQVVNKVASQGGTGTIRVQTSGGQNFDSNNSLNVTFSHLALNEMFFGWSQVTRQRPRLLNLNNQGGYTFVYNTNFNSNSDRVAAFERALNSWRCNTFVNFRVEGSTSVGLNSSDGINVVIMDSSLPAGTLAVTYQSFLGAGNSSCQQANTVWWTSDIDIAFRTTPSSNTSWNYGPGSSQNNQYDFESVALHELGHAHGLGHIINTNAVMYFAITQGTDTRNLAGSEIAGGEAKMDYSTQAPCLVPSGTFGAMVPLGSGDCALPADLLYFGAERINKQSNLLKWRVENSHHNKGFELLRSSDASLFQNLAFIPENAQSKNAEYTYLDSDAGSKSWYYRLVQLDEDGSANSLKTLFVEGFEEFNYDVFSIGSGRIRISSSLQNTQIADFQIYTVDGIEIASGKIRAGETLELFVPVEVKLALYRLVSGNRIATGKVILR
jgi:hypothetical protein